MQFFTKNSILETNKSQIAEFLLTVYVTYNGSIIYFNKIHIFLLNKKINAKYRKKNKKIIAS